MARGFNCIIKYCNIAIRFIKAAILCISVCHYCELNKSFLYVIMKSIKFKYKDKIYKSAWNLMQQLIEDELVTSVLDYGRSDYLAEFYLLQEDYENGVYDYYIEDEEEFILKFKDKLGVEVIK